MYSIAGDPEQLNRVVISSYSGLFLIEDISTIFPGGDNSSSFIAIQSAPSKGRRWHVQFDPLNSKLLWAWDGSSAFRVDQLGNSKWNATQVSYPHLRYDWGHAWVSKVTSTTWLVMGGGKFNGPQGLALSVDQGQTWLELINQTDALSLRPMAWFNESLYLTALGALGFSSTVGDEMIVSFSYGLTARGVGVFRCIVNLLPIISTCPRGQTCLHKTVGNYSVVVYDWTGTAAYGTAYARHTVVHRARYFNSPMLGPSVFLATQGVGILARAINDTDPDVSNA
jgi:hypothetical protein